MITRQPFGALAGCLAAGLLMSLGAAEGRAAALRAPWLAPPPDRLLQPVAEKKTQTKSDGAKSQVKSDSGSKTTIQKSQPTNTRNSGGQSGGSQSGGGSASKSTGTKSSGTTGSSERGGSTGGGLTVGQPTKTKSPPPADTKGKLPGTQERVTGKTPSLDDALGKAPPSKGLPGKEEALGKEEAPVLNAPAPEEGGTYTTQQVTQEELDQFVEENPDQFSDEDGDGVYEQNLPLPEGSNVEVEDGMAYLDTDGDGEADYVLPADYYDPESNSVNLPVSADNFVIEDDYGGIDSGPDGAGGVVYEDRDGDGVDEVYQAYDTDGDGVADYMDAQPVEGATPEEIAQAIEEQGYGVFDPPGTSDDGQVDGKQRRRVTIGFAVAPSGTAAAGATAGSGGEASELVVSLQQLKMLHEQRVLTAVEYDNAQLRALADIQAGQDGIEGGLSRLRDLWQRRLITESPYARKRKELLDAL